MAAFSRKSQVESMIDWHSTNLSLNEQLDNFLAVIEKKQEPVCSGLDGLNTLAVIEAIKLSAKRGAAVKPEILTD